ncbi:MAG: lipoprotein carrier protein LolA [Ramlibacter sp.]|jgi:hypothetical protein|nr:lipoprotein carrier protein LolA [Ramlibacter sp.]
MIARRNFCAMALGAACLPAPAAEPAVQLLARVRQRLVDEPVLRGAFEQRKTVKGFRKPLVSSGEFVVARQRGVLWRTTVPFPSLLVVTRDRVLAKQGDGTVARRLSANDEPAVRAVSETLFGVMAADLSVLAQRFEVSGEMTAEGWRLVLLPREPQLARWIQRVELEGDRFLHAVRMQEASGDLTQLRLARHATGAKLAAEEEAQFE